MCHGEKRKKAGHKKKKIRARVHGPAARLIGGNDIVTRGLMHQSWLHCELEICISTSTVNTPRMTAPPQKTTHTTFSSFCSSHRLTLD